MFRILWGLCLLLWAAAAVHGEDTLTEDEFLAPLTRGHPALIAQSDRLGLARAERRSAAILSNPELAFSREAPAGSAHQSIWSLAWTPPLSGRRALSVEAADAELKAAEKDLESTLLGLRLQMRAAYGSWVVNAERVAVLSSHVERIEALEERMTTRANRGEESRLAARRMGLAATQARMELSLAKAALTRARAAALAWRPELDSNLRPLPPALPAVPTELSLSSRSDLEARRFELQGAEREEQVARRFVVFPELHVGWQTIEDRSLRFEGPVYGLNWSVPLFSHGQAARLGASLKKAAADARLAIAVARAEGELEGAQGAYEELLGVATSVASTLAELDLVIEGAEASYLLGESDVTDLLESLRSVLATRLSSLDLYSAALEAHRNLESAVGRPLSTGGTS